MGAEGDLSRICLRTSTSRSVPTISNLLIAAICAWTTYDTTPEDALYIRNDTFRCVMMVHVHALND
jgi:hypothetical protein